MQMYGTTRSSQTVNCLDIGAHVIDKQPVCMGEMIHTPHMQRGAKLNKNL